MKKKIYFILELLLIFVLLFAFWYNNSDFIYTIEKYSFFVFTDDYFSIAYSKPQWLTILISNFISQYYKDVMFGAFMQSFSVVYVMYCIKSTVISVFNFNNKNLLNAFAVIPGIILLILQNNYPEIYVNIQFIVVFTLLYSLSFIKSNYAYFITATLYTILLILIIPLPYCLLFFASGILYKWLSSKYHGKIESSTNLYYPSLPVLLLIVSSIFYVYKDKSNEALRKYFIMENAAEKGEWYKILENTKREDVIADYRKIRYVVLALNETGILGDKLFSYPITKSDDFIFPHTVEGQPSFFNSLFYKNLGVPNEAFHFMFQIAESTPFGMDFRSLRYLTTYSIEKDDPLLYNKYIHILSKSTFHKKYIKYLDGYAKERFGNGEDQLQTEYVPQKPFFIGVRSFLNDMASLYDSDRNIKALNLTLCGTLVDRKIDTFKNIINKYYQEVMINGELPIHYQEAIVMVYRNQQGYLDKYNISKDVIEKYDVFNKLINQQYIAEKYIINEFSNTYWFYMYARMKAEVG
ncbi:MAG: DUF6057 family protein [Bacteroidales bacterium]|nr:DUF6057 family protein [Bacteroidales bacterium]